jgi:hypothetical protein
MGKLLRSGLAAVLVLSGALATASVARASVSNSNGTNVQQGDNRTTGNQGGTSKSGDAVGGQVTGVVSSGRTSVDAKNTSKNSDVTSGNASGSNTSNSFTGLNKSDTTQVGAGLQDITNSEAVNLQEGDNRTTLSQTANATTGDGVAGQVIGAVTGAGGSTSIVAANTTNDSSVETGDAKSTNSQAAFTGLNETPQTTTVIPLDITNSCNNNGCDNLQQGDNRTTGRQTATSNTGDGVAGQVIGAVSSGATSIDASNTSDGVDVQTGNATSTNHAATFVGLNDPDSTTAIVSDITNSCTTEGGCDNVQEGNNRATYSQNASSISGDGVGGEVIGVVTSAGGSASVVAANRTTDTDIETGDAKSTNDLAAFVGLQSSESPTAITADIAGSCTSDCENLQEGDNRLSANQTATSHTGDGVGGQVLGVVSAGRASLDATNHTVDSSVDTGNADATNHAAEFVGLNDSPKTTVGGGPLTVDISGANAENLQEGDNHKTLSQTADATSGDAVAGQVAGVVTSAGGTASVVLDNTSTGIDAQSGKGHFDNTDAGFVGLNEGFGPIAIG